MIVSDALVCLQYSFGVYYRIKIASVYALLWICPFMNLLYTKVLYCAYQQVFCSCCYRLSRAYLRMGILFVSCSIALAFPTTILAQPSLQLVSEGESYSLAQFTFVYEDKTAHLTFVDLNAPSFQGFTPLNGNSLSAGYTKSAYWLKFRVVAAPHHPFDWLLEVDYPNLQHLELYIRHSDGRVIVKKGGTKELFGRESLVSPSTVFRLGDSMSKEREYPDTLSCYLRVETESSMIVPLKIHTPRNFERLVVLQYLLYGVLYGVIIAMACYNLFLWITIRERFYLYYVLYVAIFLLNDIAIKGMGAVATRSIQAPWMSILPFFMPLSALCAVLFTRNFLRPSEYSPLSDKLLRLVIGVHLLVVALVFVTPYRVIVPVIASMIGIDSIILLSVGVVSLRFGYYPARFFVAGWTVFLLGASIRSLTTVGMTRFSWVADHIPVIGVALETILLSLALADRINLIKRQQAEVLERAVAARTQELEQSNTALEEANRFKTQILSIAAHDLKNPLSQIIGFTQLAEMEMLEKNDAGLQMLQNIHHSADGMLELIKNVLDSASLELGKINVRIEPFSLSFLLLGVYETFSFPATQKGQTIIIEVEENIVLEGDSERLRQVFNNLLSNAVKYSPTGKKIWFRAFAVEGNNVRVEVLDEGPGLTDEDKSKLFGFFQRLSAQPTGGESTNGVGLAIVKKIVELHHGKIWVESEYGYGAKFIVELPVKQM